MNDQNGQTDKLDLKTLKFHLELIEKSQEQLEWLLTKQSELRIEYLTFFKKDLKEIFAGVQTIMHENASKEEGRHSDFSDIIKQVIETFRKDIEKSFAIIESKKLELGEYGDVQIPEK